MKHQTTEIEEQIIEVEDESIARFKFRLEKVIQQKDVKTCVFIPVLEGIGHHWWAPVGSEVKIMSAEKRDWDKFEIGKDYYFSVSPVK